MKIDLILSDDLINIFILLCLSAFFSASETALFSLPAFILKIWEEERKNFREKLILKLLNKPRKLLVTILLGNTFVNIGIAFLASKVSIKISDIYVLNRSYILILGAFIITAVIVFFGEILPKNFAYSYNKFLSKLFIIPIYVCYLIFSPIVNLAIFIVNSCLKILGLKNMLTDEPIITHSEIEMVFSDVKSKNLLNDKEQNMIEEVFEFEERSVKEIMTPRHEIVSVNSNASLDEVMKLIKEYGYSRIPVYENNMDNIIGILFVKDFIKFAVKKEDIKDFNLKDYLHEVFFIPETKTVSELFKDLKNKKAHLSIVVDEYGGTEGLITIEDILEEVVGEILDEYDVEYEENDFAKINDKCWIINGSVSLSDVEDELNIKDYFDEKDIVSIGGLIYSKLDRIPQKGESIKYKDLTITVEEMNGNRIEKVLICLH